MATDSAGPQTHDQFLDEVLGAYFVACEVGQAPARDALLKAYPELADELARFFAMHDNLQAITEPLRTPLQRTVMSPPALNVIAPEDSRWEGSEPTVSVDVSQAAEPAMAPISSFGAGACIGDFELVAELGRGGMGVVFKAWQRSLRRWVALKTIVAGPIASAADVARFHREAEAAAHLDHPNIVPIYEVGKYQEYPFFVMCLVEGGDLGKRLDHFRASPRAAAELLASIARAVHYAHQRAVLHRDLKPSNILIDSSGRPLVSDFGLAKRTEAGPEETTLRGEPQGTPAYMAPEQALGRRELITIATDVYGLGAVLYTCLAGRPPFRGDSPVSILEQVKRKLPEPPIPNARGMDRELNTIGLKCLEKDPQRRYASALDVALDLERWLAGEPILARPVGPLGRLARWCKRNPLSAKLAATAAAILVLGVISLAYCTMVIWRQKVATELALRQAERRWAESRSVVDEMYTRFAEEWLSYQPRMQREQKALLVKALSFYQDYVQERASDLSTRRDVSEAYLRLAKIHFLLGEPGQAELAATSALGAVQQLTRIAPARRDCWRDLGLAYQFRGWLLAHANRYPEAEAACRQALQIEQRLVDQEPGALGLRRDLATTLNRLARVLESNGKVREAEEAYRRSLDQFSKLLPTSGDDAVASSEVGSALNDLAVCLLRQGEMVEPRQLLETAISRQQSALESNGRSRIFRQRLAYHEFNLSELLHAMGQYDRAEEPRRRALRHQERLADDYPDFPEFQQALAVSHTGLGRLLEETGRPGLAENSYREADSLLERMAFSGAPVADQRALLAVALARLLAHDGRFAEAENEPRDALKRGSSAGVSIANLGTPAQVEAALGLLMHETGRPAEAKVYFGKALAHLPADYPQIANGYPEWAVSLLSRESLLEAAGRNSEAEASYRKMIGRDKQLLAQAPTRLSHRHALADASARLARLLWVENRTADAAPVLAQAIELGEGIVAQFPAIPTFRDELANAYLLNAQICAARSAAAEEEHALGKAIELCQTLMDQTPAATRYRQTAAQALNQLGLLLIRARRFPEAEAANRKAAALGDELTAVWPSRPEFHSDLGACLNDMGIACSRQGKLPEARRSFEQAIVHQRLALKANEAFQPYQERFRKHCFNLGKLMIGQGDVAATARLADELVSVLAESSEAVALAAVLDSFCLPLVEKDSQLEADQKRETARRIVERVGDLLARARRLDHERAPAPAGVPAAHNDLDLAQNQLAWFLANSRQPSLRDAKRAVELASQLVARAPAKSDYWNTLGMAQYRAGNFSAAIEALEQSVKLGGSPGYDDLLLAMAYRQLHDNRLAAKCLESATDWMAAQHPRDEELLRLQAEATTLFEGAPSPAAAKAAGARER